MSGVLEVSLRRTSKVCVPYTVSVLQTSFTEETGGRGGTLSALCVFVILLNESLTQDVMYL